jgi:hypothetical protein
VSRHAFILGALFAAAAAAAPVQARDQFNSKDSVVVDPARAYVFYRSSEKLNLRVLREVRPEQRRAWESDRAGAYAKARAKYERQYAYWQKDDAEYRKLPRNQRVNPAPVKPDEVNPETFGFPPPEMSNFTDFTAGPQLGKEADGGYTYLIAVDPGTYSIYGQMVAGANGVVGKCLCMGSVKFEAKAGRIVDLGRIDYPDIEPAKPSMPLPDKLKGLPVEPADFHAAAKVPNYFGILIDRLPAIPGVLRYERDIPVDVKTEGAGAATR